MIGNTSRDGQRCQERQRDMQGMMNALIATCDMMNDSTFEHRTAHEGSPAC